LSNNIICEILNNTSILSLSLVIAFPSKHSKLDNVPSSSSTVTFTFASGKKLGGTEGPKFIRLRAAIGFQEFSRALWRFGAYFIWVRPAGRVYLEVQVLYRPDRGNC
jgi:hypothetical protein